MFNCLAVMPTQLHPPINKKIKRINCMSSLKVNTGILDITPYVGGLSASDTDAHPPVKLSSNENALGASPRAMDAYIRASDQLFRYPDGGCAALRQAIAAVYEMEPERIVCGAGSDEIIAFLCAAYAGMGDEVLFSEHGFLMYSISAKRVGATPVTAKETDLTTNVDALLEAVTEKTRIVFVANPNNPTGTYIASSEMKRLRDGLREDILLVIDGAYAEYMSEADYSAGKELVDATENCVMTRTFSKIYGLASLRIGWAYCPASIADILNRVRGPFNVCGAAQAAAIAAVEDIDFTMLSKQHNQQSLATQIPAINALGLKALPSFGNFYLVKFPEEEGKNAQAANAFLMEKGYIPRMVTNYGLPHYLRITVGMEEENEAILQLLQQFVTDNAIKADDQ